MRGGLLVHPVLRLYLASRDELAIGLGFADLEAFAGESGANLTLYLPFHL